MGEQGEGSTTDVDELDRFEALLNETAPVVAPEVHRDPVARRRRIRRVILGLGIPIALVAATAGGYVGWALHAPLPEPEARAVVTPPVPTTRPADVSLPTSGAAAVSVSGAEEYLGTDGDEIWQATGGDEARPIASITKLVTALVVLDAYPLEPGEPGPSVGFGNADVAIYEDYYVRGAALRPVQRGAEIPLRDVLATVLIPSASNYATSVARWAFGSDAAYARAAAAWLDEHGLTDTRIVDATGLDPRNTSTPSDLLALGKIALAHPVVAEIVATPQLTLDVPGRLVNTNTLLGAEGFTGLKTGTLTGSGSNLLYSATVSVGIGAPVDIVGVVLGGSTGGAVASSAQRTVASLQDGFQRVTPVARGDVITGYTTSWGGEVDVVVGGGEALTVWGDTPITADLDLRRPVDFVDGEQVGTITWTAGPATATAELVVSGTIEPPTDEWRLHNPLVLLRGD
ncbi:D-alanyl-D-alanine carboxypeptidase family protein [Microbacterium dauci]|uniref:D-alanyl-D-alanine carboxypeptidase n=1 Tax=Microbacterium dauci TaxID=3048008 RepID=A0ABT6ZCV0_9MICO|nr:D-alanyl-D-alanine carboxypeptidase [Microbacterium sp. LX3-4]MDJ1113981.1 D-alanyl-D-alanine carboxypeptidase [Microbacterium sp. LX3-4]